MNSGRSDDNSRDNQLWLQSWQDRQALSHQSSVNPLLTRFWPTLDLPAGSRVLVPMCGKSLDMLWLAEQGHEVVGIELSPIAVEAFFRENGMKPQKHRQGRFTVWQDASITILCGDYFDLTPSDIGRIDAVYDRAALTALSEHVRRGYVAQLRAVVDSDCQVFLLTVEDADEGESFGHARGVNDEISRLYSDGFKVALAFVDSVFEDDPTGNEGVPIRVEYKVYRLVRQISVTENNIFSTDSGHDA